MAPAIGNQQIGQGRRIGERRSEAHPQAAEFAAGNLSRFIDRLTGRGKNVSRPAQESRSGFGEAYPTLAALEQAGADLFFERTDLDRQRRLADVQPFGCPSEIELFGDGDEVAEVAQLH